MQKHVNLVDLAKSFPTNIYLQNLASIQKRASPVKFAHLAEKSGKGLISNLSTKARYGRGLAPGLVGLGPGAPRPGVSALRRGGRARLGAAAAARRAAPPRGPPRVPPPRRGARGLRLRCLRKTVRHPNCRISSSNFEEVLQNFLIKW